MSEFDPERLIRALVDHDVDFVVIGLLAAWLQGNPTVTLDLDVMPRRDLDNADRLAAALNSLGVRSRGSDDRLDLERADFLGWQSQQFDTEAGPIDVVPLATAIGGFEDVAAVEIEIAGAPVRVVPIDDVIASKEELGRPKDLAAMPALYATREALRKRPR